jgi:hypothetical protein
MALGGAAPAARRREARKATLHAAIAHRTARPSGAGAPSAGREQPAALGCLASDCMAAAAVCLFAATVIEAELRMAELRARVLGPVATLRRGVAVRAACFWGQAAVPKLRCYPSAAARADESAEKSGHNVCV